MAGLVLAIHGFLGSQTWMPATSPGMTTFCVATHGVRPPGERNHSAAGAGILDDRSKQFPTLAVELHHLQLFVDAIIGRRCAADYTGQGQIELDVLEAGGLLHDVLSGEVVATAPEHLDPP